MSEPRVATSGSAARDLAPGTLVAAVGDRRIDLELVGGGSWSLPVGVVSLVEGPLERADRPRPEQLTNALGIVADHFDDVLIEAPIVAGVDRLAFAGPHARMVARVEVGDDELDLPCTLERADADEVFRTIVVESRSDRLHNPGLDPDHVDTVVAACCAMLAIMRRLDVQRAEVVD